jgi:hypothetical protein
LHDELRDRGFSVVAVALDDSADAVRPFVENITMPVLLDREHLLAELLAISNVPTVVWIDENGRIVRPNASEFGTDTFIEFTGISGEGHKQQIRDWVDRGVVPSDGDRESEPVEDLSVDEVAARLHFRMATHLLRDGDEAGAARHFDSAIDLAPLDFTIARAAMPLRGGNPFGEEFFALYERWQAAGSPYHGIRPTRPSDPPTTSDGDEITNSP